MSCRLAGLVQQEGAARTAAGTLSSQLREQLDDLQNRLDASVAAEDISTRKLRVYKQQVSQSTLWTLLPGVDLLSIRIHSSFTQQCA